MGFKKKTKTAAAAVLISTMSKAWSGWRRILQLVQTAKSRSVRIHECMGTRLCCCHFLKVYTLRLGGNRTGTRLCSWKMSWAEVCWVMYRSCWLSTYTAQHSTEPQLHAQGEGGRDLSAKPSGPRLPPSLCPGPGMQGGLTSPGQKELQILALQGKLWKSPAIDKSWWCVFK